MPRGLPRTLAVPALLSVAACARTAGAPEPVVGPRIQATAEAATRIESPEPFGPSVPEGTQAWASALSPIKVISANTGAKSDLLLYEANGSVDPSALHSFSEIAADHHGTHALEPRLVQLAVKAAQHFHAKSLVVVSAYRQPRKKDSEDHHARGEALDFQLPGTDYRQLAAYLRTFPRAGVGVYTNPKTHYVHLDVREKSFHWLDASPPGVTWREAGLADPKQAARDAEYNDKSDLPFDTK